MMKDERRACLMEGQKQAIDRGVIRTRLTGRREVCIYMVYLEEKMSFLLHAARTRVLICGTHMLQMLLFLLWSDHHDKGPACSINRESDWFHILLWFSDRLPGATSRSMSDSIHPSYTDTPPLSWKMTIKLIKFSTEELQRCLSYQRNWTRARYPGIKGNGFNQPSAHTYC